MALALSIQSHVEMVSNDTSAVFGREETRGCVVALQAAVAAYRLQRPVRCMLDRNEDMMITGNRHDVIYSSLNAKWASNQKVS